MQDTEYICKTQNCPFVKTHVRIIFARHGLCEVVRPVAAVSSPNEGSSPTGVSADGGWVVEDAEDGRMLGGGARVEAGGCLYTAPVCSPHRHHLMT